MTDADTAGANGPRRARARAGQLRHRPHARRDGGGVRAASPEGAADVRHRRPLRTPGRARRAHAHARGARAAAAPMRSTSRPSTPTGRAARRRRIGAGRDSCTRACRSSIRGPDADQPMGDRRRRALDLLQRRGLRLARRRARSSADRGVRVPHVVGHRVHPARLRGVGHRRPAAALARHVRLRHRRFPHAARARRPRPAGPEADRVRASRWRIRVRVDGAQRAAVAAARRARPFAGGDRRLSRASLRAGAAHDLRQHRAAAQRASAGIRARHRAAVRASLLVAATRAGAATAARCSTRRSSCGWSPTGRWACSCRAASTPARSPAGWPRRGTPDCIRSRRRFPVPRFDESAEAAATAEALRLPNERIVVPTTIRDDFARIVAALDEPFADPSSFPTWYLARGTERHVKVVLGGDGGDELFARLQARRQASAQRAGAARCACRCRCCPTRGPRAGARSLGELALDWESAYALRFSGLTPNQRRFLQPSRRVAARALLARAGPRARDAAGSAAALGLRQLPARVRAAQGGPVHDGARTRAARAVARPPVRRGGAGAAARRALHDAAEALSRARWRPSWNDWARSRARSAASTRRSTAGSKDDLQERLPAAAQSLARLTGGQLDGARVQAMIDAYATTPALAEQVLSLVDPRRKPAAAGGRSGGWRVAARRCGSPAWRWRSLRWGWRRRRPAIAAAHPRAASPAARRHADGDGAAREAARAVPRGRHRR